MGKPVARDTKWLCEQLRGFHAYLVALEHDQATPLWPWTRLAFVQAVGEAPVEIATLQARNRELERALLRMIDVEKLPWFEEPADAVDYFCRIACDALNAGDRS